MSAPPTANGAVELAVAPAPARVDRSEFLRLARRARWLSWASLGYMTLEGVVALIAGIVAGSIALTGFGIDSAIEGVASLIVVWRFTGSRLLSEHAEERAQKLVAISFFLLAPYITVEAGRDLVGGHQPEASWVGVGLAASSIVLMPMLGIAKRRIGERIGSPARAPRTCSAPTWRWPSWSGLAATLSLASGGSTRWRLS